MKKRFVTNDEITSLCAEIAIGLPANKTFFGVPRGGIAPAYHLAALTAGFITDDPAEADYIIDDLVDSGKTRERYLSQFPEALFIALFQPDDKDLDEWLVFPWEISDSGRDTSAEDIFVRLIEFIGEDPTREGLINTPKRMVKAWTEFTQGYDEDPATYFTTFTENAEHYDEMIVLDPIPFFSLCEHHLVPFFGSVHIAYIPDSRFAGLSKFVRAVNTFSQRLQIQERLTHQIAECIENAVQPLGVGVIIKARHLCMEMRGARTHDVSTTTSALKGVLMHDVKARNEFLHLIKKG